MKIQIDTDYMFDDMSDKQRLQLIFQLICNAANAQEFMDKAINYLNKNKEKID